MATEHPGTMPQELFSGDKDADWVERMLAALDAMMTPAERARDADYEAALARAVPTRCAWGWCTHDVDPLTNKIVGGSGPVACPCDHLPGWRSPHPAGQSKPAVPVKARGRHGSRVQRSRHRHTLPHYPSLVDHRLPASLGKAL